MGDVQRSALLVDCHIPPAKECRDCALYRVIIALSFRYDGQCAVSIRTERTPASCIDHHGITMARYRQVCQIPARSSIDHDQSCICTAAEEAVRPEIVAQTGRLLTAH